MVTLNFSIIYPSLKNLQWHDNYTLFTTNLQRTSTFIPLYISFFNGQESQTLYSLQNSYNYKLIICILCVSYSNFLKQKKALEIWIIKRFFLELSVKCNIIFSIVKRSFEYEICVDFIRSISSSYTNCCSCLNCTFNYESCSFT